MKKITKDPRRNIVICLDGTGNQIEENISNVLKLYRVLRKSDRQIVYYDQGVGTVGQKRLWKRWTQTIKRLLGLIFGLGLDDNVLRAYDFIIEHHREHLIKEKELTKRRGDHIYIFGYSRGAHTARILAGLIYEIGIIRPEQRHLAGAALTAYKETETKLGARPVGSLTKYQGSGANFRRVMRTKVGTIRFMGLWDTVSSVFIPNPTGIFPPLVRENLPHSSANPAVETVRQAIAIDEFRRMFRIDRWEKDQIYKPNIHSRGTPDPQDFKSIWFAGAHGDVGGGNPKDESGLSQFPLIWMLDEAKTAGLGIHKRMADYVTGIKPWSKTTHYTYPEPDATAKLHRSLKGLWWIFEIIPKRAKKGQKPLGRNPYFGWYSPWGERRRIPEDAVIHDSVLERIAQCPDYRPKNVPKG